MRTLCLNLQQSQSIQIESHISEAFLCLSPRVQFRYPHYIFIDIESTSHLLGGEFAVLKKGVDIARQLVGPTATGAIADHPFTAQVMTHFRPFDLTEKGKDQTLLKQLSVATLVELEGLLPWTNRTQVQYVIQFFQAIGLHGIGDILHFQLPSFRERWGETGITLWRRLHLLETQVISPFLPVDPLIGYGHFDDPISLLHLLMPKIQLSLHSLFLRLEGLSRFARKIAFTLHCEYSQHHHTVEVEPVSPNRDLNLFCDLLAQKLDSLDLENPIREFEIEVFDVPEKSQQLDFFEPRDLSEDRWRRLISFAQQAQIEMGFLQPQSSHFPEKSFTIKTDWPSDFSPKDQITESHGAVQVKAVYAKDLNRSPRPSLLLKEAITLSQAAVKALRFISRLPIERIESSWWEFFRERPSEDHRHRDYYFAFSQEGQLCWIYQDRDTKQYFLHGYFD